MKFKYSVGNKKGCSQLVEKLMISAPYHETRNFIDGGGDEKKTQEEEARAKNEEAEEVRRRREKREKENQERK